MIKEKSFYRSLAAIALPIALQNIISFAVQMLDTIMVGKLGDYELSATSLANQPFFVFTLLGFGLASGGAVLISQYWGRGNVEIVRRIMGISVRAITVAAVFFMVVCQIFPTEIMSLMSKEAPVIELGASYLRVVSFSYIFNGMSSCYMNSLRAVENVKLSTFTYAISFLVNGTFNYLFIFGKCGFPELGVVGAAIGTVIARFVELAIVLVYSTFVENKVKFNFSYLFKREKELLPDYIRTSIPVVGSELAWSMGTVVQAAIIGNIGSVFVSANSIAGVLQQLAMVMMFGIGNAAAVEMG
ncbi:MAG: MATE family efflux transporter, partial [Oscillospiraceae bacterium]